jgi:alpha-galactosidase
MRRLSYAAVAAVLVTGGLAVVGGTGRPAYALDDGLARTPPMGYNNWNSTGCGAAFNADFVKQTADFFVSSGLKAAGYTYVNIDDCWALPDRDADGNLVPNPARFPDGIKAIADYVHDRGLKFGIYTSAGTKTCNKAGGFPGGLGHEQQDANLFASWGVDYVKYDNCNNQGVDAVTRYTAMRDALKATGRPITYSICEWGQNKPWNWGAGVGHLWRTTGDISDNWSRVVSIIHANMALAQFAGPGHWNDPDMLEVGNGHLTDTEYRSHFSLWAMMAAPLLIGTDLRRATPSTMDILLNTDVIALDQDPLGVQGAPIRTRDGLDVFVKPLSNGDRAVALFNETDQAQRISTSASEVGLPAARAYHVRDLWAHTDREIAGRVTAMVPAHGTALYRVSADRNALRYPPFVDLSVSLPGAYPGAPAIAGAGKTVTATTAATNLGVVPAVQPRVELTGPAGWPLTATGPTQTPQLNRDATLTTTWSLTVPAGTPPGSYPLTATVTWLPPDAHEIATSTVQSTVLVPTPPVSGTNSAGDLPWLRAMNGFGPVERNTSNGESKAGDGHPITIEGVVYPKGLGVHAFSTVEFYTAGQCSTVDTFAGVDDEKGPIGSVDFQIWADGVLLADSGVMTGKLPAVHFTVDASLATTVRLVVTDAGDGINSDHADWAGATLTCA